MPTVGSLTLKKILTVEQALVQGERLGKDSTAYENLRREAVSLRLENDVLTEQVAELEEARAEYVAQEEQFTAKLNANGGFFAHEEEVVNMTGKIREVDYKIAGLRHKHYHNIKDVGSLKRTMSLIEKRGEVTTVLDKVNEALERGEVLDEQGEEARSLQEQVSRLRRESEKVWPKITSYEKDISTFSAKLSETQKQLHSIRDTPTREADDLRTHLKAEINQVKRMMAQLGRLRDIQRVNAQEIGMVERVRAKLSKQVRVRKLLAEGNADELADKIANLQDDTNRLRTTIKDLEGRLQPLTKEAGVIITKLREMPFEFTTETGKLREQLIASIHQESHWKERLAVLRGEKLQNIRYIALLKKALSQKTS
ncbi:unnamed protein product [Symbiodinium natans]|uniref:Uncharacterized protein n=1 Tax=Symbiodinium natans TaxID=878477 RepID=A0A812NFB9_9DINO|nr:unnamed protein product [Symbiodinium natans]